MDPQGGLIFAEPMDSQAASVAIRVWDKEKSKSEGEGLLTPIKNENPINDKTRTILLKFTI